MFFYKLGYNKVLYLIVPVEEFNAFISSSYYKFNIKRYVRDTHAEYIFFKQSLTYKQFQKIIFLMEKKYERKLIVMDNLKEYINNREIYIEKDQS